MAGLVVNRTGWGSERRVGAGTEGQSESRNYIPSTVKHGEDACVGDLDSVSD